MKTVFFCFFLAVCSLSAVGQTFSGSIAYKMSISNLPEGTSQAMLDQYIPSKMTVFIKGEKIATTTNAGPFKRIVMGSTSDTAYMIMDAASKILCMTSAMADAQGKQAKVEKPVVTKTAQTTIIAGYPSTLYKVVTKTADQEINQEVWATDQLKMPKPKVNAQSMFYTDIPGVMTKMTSRMMNMDIVVEATEISTSAPDDAEFTLPKEYQHVLFSKEAIMKAMLGK